ncbi:Hypothetical predicted protein [Pelobates cultripes]|uniref:Uncharacterized bromodomain-containing protein 10 helical domain-containing protein n=1 Tax=Pelobates cultripes TaxID=61616 RepID=A0AAD1S718_PELCU|nr:Hypothetical predicted protein [Pelobates cultripes]
MREDLKPLPPSFTYRGERRDTERLGVCPVISWQMASMINLREKNYLVSTSKGNFEDDKGSTGTSIRLRSVTRSLTNANTTGNSLIVQVIKQEELSKTKEEKRLKEQERKEAEEASQKEVAEWDRNLLSLAEPTCMQTMWEIPAIGHFLCLAQQILNLPEIVYYELERCLLMPQCSVFLSKIMTSLLSPPHRRMALHRRPNLPYRAWEATLRQKVQQWYTVVGQAENPDRCAEKIGLCSQFFKVLGEVNPLEQKGFHELPFYQKVWLLKGLCDFVYETQNEVQDAVLGQPIHECREVILGYDTQENAYIHFPQFCGADVRVYRQKPLQAPEFPIPPIRIKRTRKIKPDRRKCKYSTKNNGEIQFSRHKSPSPVAKLEKCSQCLEVCSTTCHCDNCSSHLEQRMMSSCENKDQQPFDTVKAGFCKENVESSFTPGEIDSCGEPLSPGEVLENLDKYGEATILKHDTIPLKENALKTCQVHINVNRAESPDFLCHRVAMDIIVDHPILNHKKLKLRKMRVKKKKKKKKKLKDFLNANKHGKCENIQLHTFKSFKTDFQNKLYLTKKRVKHKKHKSAKKAVSKKAISKKRKATTGCSPSGPEFEILARRVRVSDRMVRVIFLHSENAGKSWICGDRFLCCGLYLGPFHRVEVDVAADLRYFLRVCSRSKFEKWEKWYLRKQGVKELRCTLIRLLNELLPWEPKLLKAFQRNRARLKKDYDDFKKLPDSEHFTRESCFQEECETNKFQKSVTNTIELHHQELMKQEHFEKLQTTEVDMCGKGRLLKNESFPRDLLKSPTKTCKRQFKQHFCTDDEQKEVFPSKRSKFSTLEAPPQCMEIDHSSHHSKDEKYTASEASHTIKDFLPVSADLGKGTKPIQALLVKTIGNKVALTTQNALSSESSLMSATETKQVNPVLSCETSSATPLQMIYKMPDGHCVPTDQQNSSVKIQMQPVFDSKTGEKLVQQVLFLPKDFFIQKKEGKDVTEQGQNSGENQPMPSNAGGQVCVNVSPSVSISNFITTDLTAQFAPSLGTKSVVPNSPSLAVPQSGSLQVSSIESSKNISPVLTANVTPTLVPSLMSFPVQADLGRMSLGRMNTLTRNPPNTSPLISRDISEPRQELKTVCIRDSQSILVRTRGGNTGVVKVQTSQEQSSSVISPNSIFTFTPQLQSFLVSKSKTSASSTFTSPSTATPLLLPCLKSPGLSLSSSAASVSCSLMQETESNQKSPQSHPTSSSVISQVADKTVNPSNNLSTASATNSWLPSNLHGKMESTSGLATTLACNNIGDGSSVITQASSDMRHTKPKSSSIVQPDSTTPSKTEVASGLSLQKVMLVSSPPILSAGTSTNINLLPSSTPSAVTSQKLLFINAQVPTASSSSGIALQAIKQGPSPLLERTFVKPTEQPQIILLPSTIAQPVKISSAPVVSQVKDVKIGLTIGQTIVNSSSTKQNILPVNILQNKTVKGGENNQKSLGVSKALVQVVQNTSSNIGCGDGTSSGTKDVIACSDISSTSSAVAQSNNVFDSNGNYIPRLVPQLPKTWSTTTVGNTVAKSTVKTGHLSSSVLLSTTQVTRHVKNVLSTVVTPHSSSMVSSQVTTMPAVTTYQPASKDTMETVPFPSLRLPKLLATNVINSHAVLTPLSACSVCKSGPAYSVPQGPSHILQTSPVPTVNHPRAPLNDSCTHQKIVLSINTPLAPGTQITINGTRFIVPPQGLGVGSHVLLISANAKQGLHGSSNCIPLPCHNNNTEQQTPLKHTSSITQPSNTSFSASKINNSMSTNPFVHTVPHITNTAIKGISLQPVDRLPFTCPQPSTGLKPLIVPAILRGSILQPNRILESLSGTPVKDGSVLNPMNCSVKTALPSPIILEKNNADTVSPACKSSVQHSQ